MAEVEWIKLNVRIFDNKKIKEIRRVYKSQGNDIVLIWIMLLALAGQCNNAGFVTLSSKKNYSLESLSDELRYEEEDIHLALEVLSEYGMVTIDDGFGICINNWEKYQNIMSLERIREQGRERQARYRERQKSNNVMSQNESRYVTQENKKEDKEEETEREKEQERESEKKNKYSVHCDACQKKEECDKSVENHFEHMWQVYSEKRGKASVSKTQKQKLYKISLEEMLRAIARYDDYVKSERERGFNLSKKQGSTFFNSGYIDYLDSEYGYSGEQKNEVYKDSAGNVHGKGRQG